MSEYIRTTRECTANQLRPELFLAVRNYFQENKLGDLETTPILCYETTSTRKPANKLISWMNDGMDRTIYMAVLFTPDWLIWVRSGDKAGIQLSSADLKQIAVRIYISLLAKEYGLEVSGHIEGTKGMMRGVIAMESLSVAQKFCDELNKAIDKVNPPAQKGLSKWWGGIPR